MKTYKFQKVKLYLSSITLKADISNNLKGLTYHPPHLLQGHERIVDIKVVPKHSTFKPLSPVHSVQVLRKTVVVPVACIPVFGSTISLAHIVVYVIGCELHVSVVIECFITCEQKIKSVKAVQ